MTTPTEWMGAINQAFRRLPARQALAVRRRREPVARRHLMIMYDDRGAERVIDAQYRPWLVTDRQRRFFHRACLTLKSALARIGPLYLAHPRVRQVVPLEPAEADWFWHTLGGVAQTPQTVFDRLDSTATFAHDRWADDFWFLEPNCVGIGGIHYIPATAGTVQELVAPWLQRTFPALRLAPMDDIRALLLGALRAHGRGIGRRRLHVAFLEDQSERSGTAEFEHVADYCRRHGVRAVTADPRHLRLRRGEIYARDLPVDVFYRDTEVTEFLEMERAGVPMGVVREAFRRNQVVSSIAGEFDHKSAWELFTNPIFSRHFTPAQRALFARHVLWTRLLWGRTTTDPTGREVDLAAYVRRHRAALTIKPNREYGGAGVTFGHATSRREWERALDAALRRPGTAVVQRTARVHAEPFPQIDARGRVTLEPLYAVTGFAATPRGLAVLGRSSARAVVNVSRGGGLIAVFHSMAALTPRLLGATLILAVVTANLPSPRAMPPLALALSVLRTGQAQDDPEHLKRTGLGEALGAGLEEEGALFTRWGRPIRLPQELFDPHNDGAFKLLVVAWLMSRPSSATSEAEAAITTAIHEVVTHRDPLGDSVNANVVGKVWAALGQPEDTVPGAAARLAEAMKAEIFVAASDPRSALTPLQQRMPAAAVALNSRWGRRTKYHDLVQPVQAALARIVTVQRVLAGLQSPVVGEQAKALRTLHAWLLGLRWPWFRGVPDAIERQAGALVAAVIPLKRSDDAGVAEKAGQVARLMDRRPQVFGLARPPAAGAVLPLRPEAVRARLTALRFVAKALEAALNEGRDETVAEAFARIAQDPRSAAAGLSTAHTLETLLGVDHPKVPLRGWGPHDRALLTWTPRIARIIEKHLAEGEPMGPEALYQHLEESVAWLRRAKDENMLAPGAVSRVAARLAAWDSARAWPTPAARATAFKGLIARLKAHVGLATGLEEGRTAAMDHAEQLAEVTQRLTELLNQADLAGRTIVIGPEALARCPALGGFRGLHAQVLVPERSTTARGQLVAEAAALKVRTFIYVGDTTGADEVRRLAGKQDMSISEVIPLELSPDVALRQMYRLLRIPSALWRDMSQLRQIFQDLEIRSQA